MPFLKRRRLEALSYNIFQGPLTSGSFFKFSAEIRDKL